MMGVAATTAANVVRTTSGASISAGVWTLVGTVVSACAVVAIAIIKQWGPWKLAATTEREGDFNRLRSEIDELRSECKSLRKALDSERRHHEAERSVDRHRLNNITQCFDALVLLLETNPERAQEALVKVKEMRSAQMQAEAVEKTAIRNSSAEVS